MAVLVSAAYEVYEQAGVHYVKPPSGEENNPPPGMLSFAFDRIRVATGDVSAFHVWVRTYEQACVLANHWNFGADWKYRVHR
jgi:hypothetical protein